MKRHSLWLAALLPALFSLNSHADNLAVSIGQPGFYGTLNIGGYPPPQLIYGQPIVAGPPVYGAQPMYLYAPPKHVKHWDKNCRRYGACGAPVYFVQERWYKQVYVPQYRDRYYHDHDHGRGRGHGHHKHHRHDD